ncbi:glycine zipper 2TM domain-containing protein [Coralloluteibacterium stylophorae]|uniref:Glycine zipper 2TM domain-containing protein n=1 Tax=Coralloluteibacterium stylophorae TaxID=1776034 RepID=A0A8J7VYB2_9GAMM|nr:glycine zipper 2TM domain-containing protein [Coralloluteibacterium stylophorae]MBS7455837.1 glycine zipper 2TM domain-containing protein [Coralloluteibacterium stylophorae]
MKIKPLLTATAMSVALAACATGGGYGGGYGGGGGYSNAGYGQPQQRVCYDCGQVERIETVYGARDNSRTGAVLGGLIGAVAGNQIAKNTTDSKGRRNTATVAGAVGGAVAGNAIEGKMNEQTYDIYVRMDDGRRIVINQNGLPNGLREGAYVRVNGNDIDVIR